jgi:peptidase E
MLNTPYSTLHTPHSILHTHFKRLKLLIKKYYMEKEFFVHESSYIDEQVKMAKEPKLAFLPCAEGRRDW